MPLPRLSFAAVLLSLLLGACERTSATGTEAWAAAGVAALAASTASASAPPLPAARAGSAAPAYARSAYPLPVRSKYVGTNLGGVAYYATQFPFANMLKSSEGWKPHEDSGARDTAFAGLTPDGYPTSLRPGQHAMAAVAWNNAHYPMGRYSILWDGDGKLSTPLSQVTVVASSANRLVVETKDNTGPLFVSIDRTNPADPVRNVRFLWPGTEATHATQPFTPEFLEKTAPFSVLRFMDWGATNGSTLANWADRPKPEQTSWAQRGGVPLEVMIELANTLRADPWFCIPHLASDDYVIRMAALLHERLDPALKVHIEFSNEVWNWGFTQTSWARDRAKALGLPMPWGTGANYYAQRSVEVFKLFQRAYGPDSSRLVRVIAGQSAWTAFQTAALAWKDTASQTDALAIAPYFNAETASDIANAARTATLTPEQVLDEAVTHLRTGVKKQLDENAALARKHKLKLLGYESGPHLTSSTFPDAAQREAITRVFTATNRLPRMREVYREYNELWITSGGEALLQYADIGPWSHFGSWGALEYLTQDPATAPKYQGLLDAIAAHPTPPR